MPINEWLNQVLFGPDALGPFLAGPLCPLI